MSTNNKFCEAQRLHILKYLMGSGHFTYENYNTCILKNSKQNKKFWSVLLRNVTVEWFNIVHVKNKLSSNNFFSLTIGQLYKFDGHIDVSFKISIKQKSAWVLCNLTILIKGSISYMSMHASARSQNLASRNCTNDSIKWATI